MKRLLVLGDSLSLPRDKPEHCSHEQTWPQLLLADFIVHQVSIGGATIKDLNRQLEYHRAFRPDIVVIQSGIVDCAPRSLSQFELETLSHFKVSRKLLLPVIHRYSKTLRKYRRVCYTPANKYKATFSEIIKKLPGAMIFALSILPGNDDYEKTVPGISKKIHEYNQILKDLFGDRYVSLEHIKRSGIMSDHIHLNEEGHREIYELLVKTIT